EAHAVQLARRGAADDEARRAVDAEPCGFGGVARDRRLVARAGDALAQPRGVQSLRGGERLDLLLAQLGVLLQQRVVHRPEPALGAGAVRGFRREARLRMDLERQVAHDEAQSAGVDPVVLEAREGPGLEAPAVRAL